jgi:cytochrome c
MIIKLFLSIGSGLLAGLCFTAFSEQENSPPIVTIVTPATSSRFQWNSMVPYTIHVSDREDGDSEFNEISTNEVLLTVSYLPDSSRVSKYLLENANTPHPSLLRMSTSTCFSCHAAKTRLIGPSFEEIARRYANPSVSVDSLAHKIISGSSGTWGDLKMPPHPDLKLEQAREVVQWILQNGADPDRTYFAGVQGTFRTRGKPDRQQGKAVYVLTASYTDYGRKKGQQSMVLKGY